MERYQSKGITCYSLTLITENGPKEFLTLRLSQGHADTVIKSFEISMEFADQVRSLAVLENEVRDFPDMPIRVDIKAHDQFGLRNKQIDLLKLAIKQGTGKIEN